jgi:hypothetical protein
MLLTRLPLLGCFVVRLQWKRKAEQYLINSGLNYTIIHPGGNRQSNCMSSTQLVTGARCPAQSLRACVLDASVAARAGSHAQYSGVGLLSACAMRARKLSGHAIHPG